MSLDQCVCVCMCVCVCVCALVCVCICWQACVSNAWRCACSQAWLILLISHSCSLVTPRLSCYPRCRAVKRIFACLLACVRACVCACVRACWRVWVQFTFTFHCINLVYSRTFTQCLFKLFAYLILTAIISRRLHVCIMMFTSAPCVLLSFHQTLWQLHLFNKTCILW